MSVNVRPLVFGVPGQESLAARLAAMLPAEPGHMEMRQFPDGETYVRLDSPCADRDVVLAAPYLAYMRQDIRFKPGEVVTSAAFAEFLTSLVDGVVTVDPHLHRYRSLSEIYGVPARVVHAASGVAGWIAAQVADPVLVGPDSESEQWMSDVAGLAKVPYVVLSKTRRGDRDVEIEVPPLERWRGRTPVLVDDIVSTAGTMIELVGHLRGAGYPPPVCVAVHGLFVDDAYAALERAGAGAIVTADTVAHPSNRIDLSGALAAALRELLDPASL